MKYRNTVAIWQKKGWRSKRERPPPFEFHRHLILTFFKDFTPNIMTLRLHSTESQPSRNNRRTLYKEQNNDKFVVSI